MTYPMPPELLAQLGLEPCADTDPPWPDDHDVLGWSQRVSTTDLDESDRDDRVGPEGVPDDR